MQSKAVEIESPSQEDKTWLESDLSGLSDLEPYEWRDTDPETMGKSIHYEEGVGFVIVGTAQ
jgi:hypothetical protein